MAYDNTLTRGILNHAEPTLTFKCGVHRFQGRFVKSNM